jgi:hypothetical protein
MTAKDVKAAKATRMRFYKDKTLNVTEELERAAEHNDHQLYVVSKILKLCYNDEEMRHEELISWRGLDTEWEPCGVMAADVQEMMRKFLDSCKDKKLVDQVHSR